jgi:nicotinamidase/pyrazinamidase
MAVDAGDEVVEAANSLMDAFDLVVATQDWHPPEHVSFASNHHGKRPGDVIDVAGMPQALWPDHCVQDTVGAQFHPRLQTDVVDAVFHKGVDPQLDSYSGFFDNARLRATGLGGFLSDRGADEVWLVGLATDYCIKATALDAVELGFTAVVVEDGVRAVDLAPGDGAKALDSLREAGVRVADSSEA